MNQSKISIQSPAKLNLFLHVYQARPDGYHDLDTLFELIDLMDEIQIEIQASFDIQVFNSATGIPPKDDLCYRAAKLLQETTQVRQGAKIWINKNIPMGGGLGGGSSNAATVLVVLNYLWQTGLSQLELQELGLLLGSDVPIFIYGQAARAGGRGEQFCSRFNSPFNKNCYYIVANPKVHVSTKGVFQSEKLKKRKQIDQSESIANQLYSNDFETVVFYNYPKIKKIKDKMEAFAPAHLTGTGSCLYSILDDKGKADRMINALKRDCNVFLAKGLHKSPVLEFI